MKKYGVNELRQMFLDFMERMMRHLISGQKRSVFLQRGSHVFTVTRTENVITSGSMAQVLADHVLRFIMTVEKNTDAAARTAK